MKKYRVLSLDISSSSTGWSFISNKVNSFEFGTIRPTKKLEFVEKLHFFRNELIKLLKHYKPTEIVIEDTFLGINPKVNKLLSKFGGVGEQTIYEFCGKGPYIMSNTTPKSYFEMKTKEHLFKTIIYFIDFGQGDLDFKKWNDITDSVAQLLCYCDTILKITKHKKEKDYGYQLFL